MLDVLITDGVVVDGTGAPRRRADVGVRGGRVVAVGQVDEAARRTVDAAGQVVAPGFVDVHTHLDVQGFWDPTLSPSPLHGVTTVLGGNCGFTVAPLVEREADYLMRMLARVEGMPLEVLERHVPWDWHSTAEYFGRLKGRLAVNAGFMVGHSTLRRVVMGDAGSERAATDEEMAAMRRLLRDGLDAGALGFSTSWSESHLDADGNPVPSRFATADELATLSATCREVPGTSLEFLAQAFGPFTDAVADTMVRMTVGAQRPLNWNVLFPARANRDECEARLSVSTRAKRAGGKVVGLVMPIREPVRLTFWSGRTFDMLPGWQHAMTLPHDQRVRLLADPHERRRLADLAAQADGVARAFADWGNLRVVETFADRTQQARGRLVRDIAADERKDPFDALLDVACADDLRATFTFNRDPMDPADWPARVELIRDERTLIGGSDAGAHIGESAQFHYPTVLLAEAVRKHQVLTLEEVIAQMTDQPARLYGLRDRGRIVPGAWADLVILDPDRVRSDPITFRFDLPEKAARLAGGAVGIDRVLVNGEEIVHGGEFTGQRPGHLLRSGRDTTTPTLD